MTREYRHSPRRVLTTALHWVRSHLPRWRRRPPTVGVREPRRPKPALPAAAVALKEPRVGLMRWIKLGSERPGDHAQALSNIRQIAEAASRAVTVPAWPEAEPGAQSARLVSACWLAPVDGIGISVIVFETKEYDQTAVGYPLLPLPGVTPLTLEIREVYASA